MILTTLDLARIYRDHTGWDRASRVLAIGIALAESGAGPQHPNCSNSRALNDTPPDLSYGSLQINMLGALGPDRRKRYGLKSNEELFDPPTNARVGFMIQTKEGKLGWRHWSTFKGKRHEKFLGVAEQAVAELEREEAMVGPWYMLNRKLYGVTLIPGKGGRSVLAGSGKDGTARKNALEAAKVPIITDAKIAQQLQNAFPVES